MLIFRLEDQVQEMAAHSVGTGPTYVVHLPLISAPAK